MINVQLFTYPGNNRGGVPELSTCTATLNADGTIRHPYHATELRRTGEIFQLNSFYPHFAEKVICKDTTSRGYQHVFEYVMPVAWNAETECYSLPVAIPCEQHSSIRPAFAHLGE